ncbi:MAG: MFS transporter [Bauldia sp.]|nr:MAG: MFS transporter [Bauldia sp.]
MPIAVFALTISAFAIGTTEFVIMGLLPIVASDLHVSIPAAGMLVTGYALGVVAGAPILTVATSRMERKPLLIGLMGLFILGNLIAAIAPSYAVLMVARIVASFTHGAFFGVGSVVAASLVPADKKARAIAMMFTGLALANILGVPGGTAIGQAFGWRATFWAVTALGVISTIALSLLVKPVGGHGGGNLRGEIAALRHPPVWVALGTTMLGFGGVFVVLTYIAPILQTTTGLSPRTVTIVLFIFGIGLTIGNTIGGHLADKALMPSLIGILAVLAAVMAVFAVTMHFPIAAIATIFVWGVASFATVPALQTRVVEKARHAPNLAASLNIGAFNLGNALGAALGGGLIDLGFDYPVIAIAGALVAAGGCLLAVLGKVLDDREVAVAAQS